MLASPLAAQQWPARTIRIVTGTPAGGSPDFVSRLLADKLMSGSARPSWSRMPPPPGSRPGAASPSRLRTAHVISMLTGRILGAGRGRQVAALRLSLKDFTFITMVSGYPMVVATAPSSPIKSFRRSDRARQSRAFDVTFGMNLPGSVHHLTGELINVEAGIACAAFRTAAIPQILQDLLGGRLDRDDRDRHDRARPDQERRRCAGSRSPHASVSRCSPTSLQSARRCRASRSSHGWAWRRPRASTRRSSIGSTTKSAKSSGCRTSARNSPGVGNIPMPSSPEDMQAYIERDTARWNRVVDLKGIERF